MSQVKQYRKKPIVIEALLWDDSDEAADAVYDFMEDASWSINAGTRKIDIVTLEGTMSTDIGDYIIKGVQGEFYPCKPDIFEATYEVVE